MFRRETLDIEEGADRILTQVLAPRTISMFEPSIAMAVNEHFGIANETAQVEVNGMSNFRCDLISSSFF